MTIKQTTLQEVDTFIEPLRDNQFLLRLIAEISKKPISEVTERFIQEHRDLGCNVRIALEEYGLKPHVWSQELEQFYAKTDAFLYETLVWNRSKSKNEMRSWIGSHLMEYQSQRPARRLRILSFGDGLGIDAYYLAKLGYEVTYFDPSETCTYFAKQIFTRGELQVKMLSKPEDLQTEAFDVIVCLDVLEHVENPSSLVGWLCQFLKPAGRFIVHAPFFYLEKNVATHLRSNQCYSGDTKKIYEPHDLVPLAAEFFWNPLVLELRTEEGLSKRSELSWLAKLGGILLTIGRVWSWPHVKVARFLSRDKELQKMAEELKPLSQK